MAESVQNGIYEVDRILRKRVHNGNIEYFIHWQGFSSDWNTWEPKQNLSSCTGRILEFEKNNPSIVQTPKSKFKNIAISKVVNKSKTAPKSKTSKVEKKTTKSRNMAIKLVKKSKTPRKTLIKNKGKIVKAHGENSPHVIGKMKTTSPSKEKRVILKPTKLISNAKISPRKASSEQTKLKLQKDTFITKKVKEDKTVDKMQPNKGVKRKRNYSGSKISGKTTKKKLKKLVEEEDDDNILYSLVEGSESSPPKSTAVKSDIVKPKEINNSPNTDTQDKNVDKKLASFIKDSESAKSPNKRLSLLDALKKPIKTDKIPNKQVAYYTSVKPLMTSSLLTKAMPSHSMTMESYFADIPSYQMAGSIPGSPSSISYKALLENLPRQMHPKKKKRIVDTESEDDQIERRTSVRSAENAFKNKEIVVKKCHHYTQIWLNTQTRLKNSLNPQVIQEIVTALNSAKYDDSNLVMFSSIGNVFCSGVDLNFLTTGDPKIAARKMSDSVRDLVKTFITFPKPIIAVVTGAAVGLGMAILPLCDITYASDKALFYLPYSTLSQTPEGCASFTLPQVLGLAVGSEILFCGRKLTALEAHQLGLVSQVFWPTSMMQEVIPRIQQMAMFSGKALETTKLLIRCHNRTKLELTNETECNLLLERWPSSECQRAVLAYLDNEKNFIF